MEEGAVQIPIQVTGRTDTNDQGEGNDVTPGQRGIKRSPPDDDDGGDRDMRGSSCSQCYGDPDPAPRGRRGDSSDDDYKEDPFDLYNLRQRQLGNNNSATRQHHGHLKLMGENPSVPNGSLHIRMSNLKSATYVKYRHTEHAVTAGHHPSLYLGRQPARRTGVDFDTKA